MMAIAMSSRRAADEEARAEVEVLTSRLERTAQLTKKIQASLSRLESSGRSVQEAIGPIHNNVQKLQILGSSMGRSSDLLKPSLTGSPDIDSIIGAIDRIKEPSDIRSNEEDIIRAGYTDHVPSLYIFINGLISFQTG